MVEKLRARKKAYQAVRMLTFRRELPGHILHERDGDLIGP